MRNMRNLRRECSSEPVHNGPLRQCGSRGCHEAKAHFLTHNARKLNDDRLGRVGGAADRACDAEERNSRCQIELNLRWARVYAGVALLQLQLVYSQKRPKSSSTNTKRGKTEACSHDARIRTGVIGIHFAASPTRPHPFGSSGTVC